MDFVEPARAFTLELVGGRGHYERVVRAAMEAKRSVWIATANLKELMVEDHRAAPGRRRTLRTGARAGRGRLSIDPGRVRRAGRPRGRAADSSRRAAVARVSGGAGAQPAARPHAGAARLPARPLQDGDRRRRVRLRRQRQLDRRRPRRQGGGTPQLRARRSPARTTASSTGRRRCSTASGAAPPAGAASCARSARRRSTAAAAPSLKRSPRASR